MKKREQDTQPNPKVYSGAIVLGLNDALVELSGALVGLAIALSSAKLIATVGIITGFAAALSMAASEYLSAKEDKRRKPFTAAIYTGIAYLITVVILVTPYFAFTTIKYATLAMIALAILIIAGYTKYAAAVNKVSFKQKFFSMFTISAGVAVVSFIFGLLIRRLTE